MAELPTALTTKKLRRLELAAGAPRWQGGRNVWSVNQAMRHAERELALQAQRAYERSVADWQAQPRVRARHRGAHLKAVKRQSSATDLQAPTICALARRHPHPRELSHRDSPSTTTT